MPAAWRRLCPPPYGAAGDSPCSILRLQPPWSNGRRNKVSTPRPCPSHRDHPPKSPSHQTASTFIAAFSAMLSLRDAILGPWRAVLVLGVTQILAWGAIFYPPVL